MILYMYILLWYYGCMVMILCNIMWVFIGGYVVLFNDKIGYFFIDDIFVI